MHKTRMTELNWLEVEKKGVISKISGKLGTGVKKTEPNLSPVKQITKNNTTDKLNNMKQISANLLDKDFYTLEDTKKNHPFKLNKFSESTDPKSQKLYKYTQKLSKYVKSHLSEIKLTVSQVKILSSIELDAINRNSKYNDYLQAVKGYNEVIPVNISRFHEIKSLLLKNSDLQYLSKLLNEINTQWVDIVYGSEETQDIKKLVCNELSKNELALASIGIKANENATFQNGKFLNYILNYASQQEKKEFSDINEDFGFLPKAKMDLVDIPSSEGISKEQLKIELDSRKKEILQEVSVIITKNEEIMLALSEAITTEERFREKETALFQQYERQKQSITQEYNQMLESKEREVEKHKEEIESIRLETKKNIELLEKTKNEQINKIKEQHQIEIQAQDEKIKSLEVNREEYLQAKADKIELEQQKIELEQKLKSQQDTIDRYEEALTSKLQEIEVRAVALVDHSDEEAVMFSDEEDGSDSIEENNSSGYEFIANMGRDETVDCTGLMGDINTNGVDQG